MISTSCPTKSLVRWLPKFQRRRISTLCYVKYWQQREVQCTFGRCPDLLIWRKKVKWVSGIFRCVHDSYEKWQLAIGSKPERMEFKQAANLIFNPPDKSVERKWAPQVILYRLTNKMIKEILLMWMKCETACMQKYYFDWVSTIKYPHPTGEYLMLFYFYPTLLSIYCSIEIKEGQLSTYAGIFEGRGQKRTEAMPGTSKNRCNV